MTCVSVTSGDEADDRYISLMAKDQYLRQLRWMARLTPEEETRYVAWLARGKRERATPAPDTQVLSLAQEARNQLVVNYQFLVIAIAQRLLPSFHHMELMDLVNEVNERLLTRLEEYCDNPAWEGCPFTHFVSCLTYKALFGALRFRDRMVKLPNKICTLLNQKRALEREWHQTFERSPSARELAERLVLSEAVLVDVIAYERYLQVESVQALLAEDEMEEEQAWVSLWAEPSAAEQRGTHTLVEPVQLALEQVLTAREREVITLRYRFDDQGSQRRTLEMVAQVLGIDFKVVSETEQRALERLRQALDYRVEGRWVRCVLREPYTVAYYRESEAVRALGLSATTFRRRVHAGLVPYFYRDDLGKMRLYPKAAIDALAVSQRQQEGVQCSALS